MLIDYDAGTFTAKITFAEKDAFKSAGWWFCPDRKRWTTRDPSKAMPFKAFASDAAHDALQVWLRSQQGAVDLSRATSIVLDRPIPVPPGLAYDPFQESGIVYASKRKDTLIADPPGLGKTIQAIGVSNYDPTIRTVLVVPPAGLKINWKREWDKWCVKGLTVGIARSVSRSQVVKGEDGKTLKDENGKSVTKTWTERVWPATDVVICNYEMLPAFESEVRLQTWDMLVCDEAQYLTSATTTRTRHVLGGGTQHKKTKLADGKIRKRKVDKVAPIPARKRLFLTGTPILSRPMDIWTLCQACDPEGLGKNWISFAYEYCNGQTVFGRLDASGASNLDALQTKLRLKFMVRRRKLDVLKDLPPKRRQLIELPSEGLAKLADREISAMARVREALKTYEASISGLDAQPAEPWTGLWDVLERRFGSLAHLDYEARAAALQPAEQAAFEEMSQARRDLAAAKLPMVVEHLENLLSSGEKVIVFTVHKEMANALKEKFPACAFITGATPVNRRQGEVDRFQEDPACNPMIGNITAAGVGFTMTAAALVVFAELDWVPSSIEQAEDRAWRRGQRNAVLVQHLVVEGSLDAHLVQVLLQKQKVIDAALDTESDVASICSLT